MERPEAARAQPIGSQQAGAQINKMSKLAPISNQAVREEATQSCSMPLIPALVLLPVEHWTSSLVAAPAKIPVSH